VKTVNTALKGIGLLVATYLVVQYASGSGRVISTATTGATNLVKALQGR
jgi:hypothetical protein